MAFSAYPTAKESDMAIASTISHSLQSHFCNTDRCGDEPELAEIRADLSRLLAWE